MQTSGFKTDQNYLLRFVSQYFWIYSIYWHELMVSDGWCRIDKKVQTFSLNYFIKTISNIVLNMSYAPFLSNHSQLMLFNNLIMRLSDAIDSSVKKSMQENQMLNFSTGRTILCFEDAATDVWFFFWYLEWAFDRSNCAKFQITFTYENWIKKLLKVLWQIATMK